MPLGFTCISAGVVRVSLIMLENYASWFYVYLCRVCSSEFNSAGEVCLLVLHASLQGLLE